MNADDWQHLKRRFADLIQVPAEQREVELEALRDQDPELTRELQSMLRAEALLSSGFLSQPLVPSVTLGPLNVGDRVGPYTLESVIGEGGMGRVYRARQSQPVAREVAVKVMRTGLPTPLQGTLFVREQQALALLTHEHIARVYECGTTASGLPWFAMEYIDGIDLLRHCDGQRLDLTARLQLFEAVCHGVAHAHQKGVIHRDLKPGNILIKQVDDRHVPVVIDFGLSKIIDSDNRGQRGEASQLFAGTPEFMSPEQAGVIDADVDTRTDVYALGVVLHHLLCGSSIHPHGRMPAKCSHNEAPLSPLAALQREGDELGHDIAECRNLRLGQLKAKLKGEVGWVVHRCLARGPDDRYPSVWALIADIRALQTGQLVSVGPQPWRHRSRAFVRRHRLGVAVGSVALTGLVATLVALAFGLQTARQARAKAEQAAERAEYGYGLLKTMFSEVDPRREGVELKIGDLYSRLSEELTRRSERPDPRTLATMHHLLARGFLFLDQLDRAEKHVHEELAIFAGHQDLDGQHEAWLAAQVTLAECRIQRADFEGSLQIVQPLMAVSRDNLGVDHQVTQEIQLVAALTHLKTGDYERGEQLAVEALRVERGPDDDFRPLLRVKLRHALASIMCETDRSEAGREQLALALASLEHRAGMNIERLSLRYAHAKCLMHSRELDAAKSYLKPLIADQEQELGRSHRSTQASLEQLFDAHLLGREYAKAADIMREVIATREKTRRPDHPSLINARGKWLICQAKLGRFKTAEKGLKSVIAGLKAQLSATHPAVLAYEQSLATLYTASGEFEVAKGIVRGLIEAKTQRFGGEHSNTLRSIALLAKLQFLSHQQPAARELCERVLAIDRGHGNCQYLMGKQALDNGALEVARRHFDAAAKRLEHDPAFLFDRARLWTELGEVPRALPLLHQLRRQLDREIASVEVAQTLRAFPRGQPRLRRIMAQLRRQIARKAQ